jgi:hypothetical protein
VCGWCTGRTLLGARPNTKNEKQPKFHIDEKQQKENTNLLKARAWNSVSTSVIKECNGEN